ncbi:MAG TPA: transposase [Candidatus Baltobacteraceae bacterium]|nr:transposase [Candidatus Baltobacteraceae bacterium]
MTMVGGFDVHRKQITFDYVDDDGLVHWGEIRPATRKTLRGWLGERCPSGDAEFALEGCTGWRYVVEELAMAGVVAHVGDPAEIAGLRGPKKRAKTDRADARLLRTLLVEGRFPESWIPPAHVVEVRTLGRLYCALMEERRAWQQRIHAQLFHQGCRSPHCCRWRVATRSPVRSCRGWDASMWTRRCGALMSSVPRLCRCEHNW